MSETENVQVSGIDMEAFLRAVFRATGADEWPNVKGKYVRVERGDGGIESIGHITENDRWFKMSDFARKP